MIQLGERDWQNRTMRGLCEEIRWFPLLSLGSHGLSIGISANGDWVVDTAEGLANASSKFGMIAMLPFLEHEKIEVETLLVASLADAKLKDITISMFPYESLVLFGIEYGGYWAENALKWLTFPGSAKSTDDLIAEKLEVLVADKSNSQSLRHSARKKISSYQHRVAQKRCEP